MTGVNNLGLIDGHSLKSKKEFNKNMGFLGGLIGGAFNAVSSIITNKQNRDYSSALTQQQWERDDNAHQREVLDLQKAGLSPLASTQGSVTSDPVTSMNQAPQVDVNALVNSAIAQQDLKQRQAELEETKRQFDERMGEEKRQFDAEIELKNKQLNETIENNNRIDRNTKTQLQTENDLVMAQIENYQEIQKDNNFYRIDTAQKTLMSVLKEKYGTPNVYPVDNPAQAGELFRQWTVRRDNFIDGLLNDSESFSESNSGSGGVSAGVSSFGTGGKVGLEGSGSHSTSSSVSQSSKVQEKIKAWYSSNPMPIYSGDYDKIKKSVGYDS